jgi:hypothetical protein
LDRTIVTPSSLVQDTDILGINKAMMLAMGRLAQDMLGTGTSVGGAPCTPGAGLTVTVGPGAIYSFQNIDNTAYGALPADTAHQTIKQGTLLNAATLACPAPTTAGQSINYLIEGQFQEVDTNAAVVPYYNSANPLQPFQGPNNSGSAQNTLRQGLFVVQAKAGVAATTGSQATPAADAGWTGMYVVTVDFGETTLTVADIVVATPSPFIGVTALNALSKATADTLYLPLYARIAAEIAASVTPTNTSFPTAPFTDVRRYGVVGDGTTDDTAALQLALTVSATTGFALVIPAGLSVKITSYVQMFSNTTLYILGKLQLTGRASGLYANGASNISVLGMKVGQIQDSSVFAAYTWNPGAGNIAPAIHIRSSNHVTIDGLNVSYCSQGVFASNASQNFVTNAAFTPTQAAPVDVTIKNCTMQFCEWSGIASLGPDNIRYLYNYVYRCGDGGLWMMGSTNSEVVGNHRLSPQTVIADVTTFGQNSAAHPTTWNDVQGMEFQNCHNLLISGNHVQYIQGQGIDIKDGCTRVLCTANRVENCEQYSICSREGDAGNVNACFKVTISNNIISNHGYAMFNSAPFGEAAAISVSSTFIAEVTNNVIYSYTTTPGINCKGPGTYLAGQYNANPQQAHLSVTGNSIDFMASIPVDVGEFSFTSATLSPIVINGQYTSVKCEGNHISTDRYYFSDGRLGSAPAIMLTQIAANGSFYPAITSISNNTISGWGFTAIQVNGVAGMTYSGVSVCGNTIESPGGYGIFLNGNMQAFQCNNNSITQPTNSATAYQALAISGSATTPSTGVASGNVLTGAWNTGGNNMNFSVTFQNCGDINFTNNQMAGGVTGNINVGSIAGNINCAGSSGFPRTSAGTPNGTLVSFWLGEQVFDTTNLKWWAASAFRSTVWTQLTN